MKTVKQLVDWLDQKVDNQHFIFSMHDLRAFFFEISDGAYKALIHRAARAGYLVRICRTLYTYKNKIPRDGLILYHIAARLRAGEFNYISLEIVLSDAGVISQIPINRISIISSGRSSIVDCGNYGSIEFIHTTKKPLDIMDQIFYDKQCKMWRAMVPLALCDMKKTKRNMDLIDWDVANEFI